jgi:hypothetical protein
MDSPPVPSDLQHGNKAAGHYHSEHWCTASTVTVVITVQGPPAPQEMVGSTWCACPTVAGCTHHPGVCPGTACTRGMVQALPGYTPGWCVHPATVGQAHQVLPSLLTGLQLLRPKATASKLLASTQHPLYLPVHMVHAATQCLMQASTSKCSQVLFG